MKYPLYQDTLCPKLWKEKKLDPEVQKGLLNIAIDFVNELRDNHDLPIEIIDVVIIGSVANYNWTPYSDIDLHVITDYSKLKIPAEEAQIMFDALKANWNSKHDITVKGHDVEMYVQDKSYKPSSAAEYSILNDKWIKEPVHEAPTFDKELIKKKYKEYKKKIADLATEKDEDGLRDLLDKLYKYRQAGLDAGGELSEENIIFKILRAMGQLDKIKDTVNKLYDKKMTVKETEMLGEGAEDIAKSVYEYSVNSHAPVQRNGNMLVMYGKPTSKQMAYLKNKSGTFTFGVKGTKIHFINGPYEPSKILFTWRF